MNFIKHSIEMLKWGQIYTLLFLYYLFILMPQIPPPPFFTPWHLNVDNGPNRKRVSYRINVVCCWVSLFSKGCLQHNERLRKHLEVRFNIQAGPAVWFIHVILRRCWVWPHLHVHIQYSPPVCEGWLLNTGERFYNNKNGWG